MAAATRTHGENKLAIYRLGLWLFMASESFLFLALLFTRFYLQGVQRPAELNQPLGFVISVVLLFSSLSAYRGETCAVYGDQAGFRRNILTTIGLGVLFLVGVGIEWSEGFRFFPPSTGFGTVFFALTGFHAFHVLTGVLLLAAVVVRGRQVHYGPSNYWGVEAAVKYWHFVDVAWVFIFPTLYLVS